MGMGMGMEMKEILLFMVVWDGRRGFFEGFIGERNKGEVSIDESFSLYSVHRWTGMYGVQGLKLD